MNQPIPSEPSVWYAIRTADDFYAEKTLADECAEVFLPKKQRLLPGGKTREASLIPHVLFIRTTRANALLMERRGRMSPLDYLPFWIFRYPKDPEITVISQRSIDLLRLLTAREDGECEIYRPQTFTVGERVRIASGVFEGYEGFVKRIGRDRRVVVEIEGVCMVMLPFIAPTALIRLSDSRPLTGKATSMKSP